MISVIVPAYNEQAVIARTLQSILRALDHQPGEVIVVCNGCHDRTYEIAREFEPRVKVFNLEVGSKIAALNKGDSEATGFPRFFLDADIELSENAFEAVSRVLTGGTIHAAAPRMICDFGTASWVVRAFYETWLTRPYHRLGHVGSGFVGISEQGRGRFDRFPDIIADDEFLRRQFAPHERQTVDDAYFKIKTPRDLHSLVKVKTRSRLGTYQLNQAFPELRRNAGTDETASPQETERSPRPQESGSSNGSVPHSSRQPSLTQRLAYYSFNLLVRARAYRQWRSGQVNRWERDETSRG